MDKQYDNRIRRAQRRSESGNTHRFTQNNTKKISNWKTPGHDVIHGFWFKKYISLHDRFALEMNKCLQGAHVPEWMTRGKPHWSSGPPQGNRFKQLQTFNLPTQYVENINSTNKGRYLLLANKPQTVPWRTERMPQKVLRYRRITLHRLGYPQRGQDRTKKSSYSLHWQQKAYDMVPQSWIIHRLKMYKTSDEVVSFIEKTMKTWKEEFSAGGRSLAEVKVQRGIF